MTVQSLVRPCVSWLVFAMDFNYLLEIYESILYIVMVTGSAVQLQVREKSLRTMLKLFALNL